jgi:transposase
MKRLRELVEQQPDATARELHQRLGVHCSLSAVDMALRRAGLSFKKRPFMQQNRTAAMSPSVAPHGSRNSLNERPSA